MEIAWYDLEIVLEINVSSVAHAVAWATEETLISNTISTEYQTTQSP
jgi:hypothetical protein